MTEWSTASDDRSPSDYTDALILYVLSGGRRTGMTLDRALGVMDGINRDYLNAVQWTHAVNRHISAGLLTVSEDRLIATDAGRDLVRSTRVGSWLRSDNYKSVLALEARLPAEATVADEAWTVAPNEFDAAIRLYLSRVRR